jgi:hypothetical protein
MVAAQRDCGHQPDPVGAGDRVDLGAKVPDPRDDAAVVESQAQRLRTNVVSTMPSLLPMTRTS